MADQDKENPMNLFDWNTFQHMLAEKLSILQKNLLTQQNRGPGSPIEDFVQTMVNGSIPGLTPVSRPGLRREVFETHRSVIARLQLPAGMDETKVRIYTLPNRIRLTLPDQTEEEIGLPAAVNPVRSRAEYKDRILEIRMTKDLNSRGGKELSIYYPNYS